MANPFVQTVTRNVVVAGRDEHGPSCSYVSVVPCDGDEHKYVDIVVGARFQHRCASCFSKSALAELIAMLQDVHDAMESY